MQAKPIPQFFTKKVIFSTICQYLTIRQVLNLAVVNRQLKNVVEIHCRATLMELNLRPSSRKSSIHQMQFYFNRCLRIIRQQRNVSQKSSDLTTIYFPFKFETIKSFEVGSIFSCYLTGDKKARIFKTADLLSRYQANSSHKKQQAAQKLWFESKSDIKSIKCKSDQCIILKKSGEVVYLSQVKNEHEQIIEQNPFWANKIQIQQIYNSFAYTLFFPENFQDSNQLLHQVFCKTGKPEEALKQQNESKVFLIGKSMINGKQFIVEVPCQQILQSTVGSRFAYFISSTNELFEADLQQKLDSHMPIIKAKIFQPLKGKKIAKISNGYNYYIALQRTIQQLEQWDTDRVCQWLRQIGFQAYIKIARFQKLDGKKLKGIERKYMHNVLGITTQNMQQKFIMSIEQNLNKKSRNDQLWGWGKNQSGQLGSSSANFVSKPQKIRMNYLQQAQYIDSIFCGWFQTFIRTQKGRIYCTVIKSCKRRKGSEVDKQVKQDESQQQKTKQQGKMGQSDNQLEYQYELQAIQKKSSRKKSGKGSQNHAKKRKKGAEEHLMVLKQKSNQKFKQQQNWYQFGLGKAFFIQTYKDMLFIIQCPNQYKQEQNKIVKLRPAKAILDKILWSSLNKEQFKVGYMDKDMGLIEASALDMQKFDVKQNRVKYFKRNNTIIWDRDNKIDLF